MGKAGWARKWGEVGERHKLSVIKRIRSEGLMFSMGAIANNLYTALYTGNLLRD